MDNLTALEFTKIKDILKEFALSAPGKELCDSVTPFDGINDAINALDETEFATIMLERFGSPHFADLTDITHSCKRASTGSVLSIKELMQICNVLRISRGLHEFMENRCDDTVFRKFYDSLYINKYFEDKLSTAFIGEDEVSDAASSALREIRRKQMNARSRIRSVLDEIVHSQAHQKHLQDSIVTIRNDRFVLPVKAEYKNEVGGLVHDVSASGATLFIEPMQVVAANNELSVLAADEHREIERILAEYSAEAGDFSGGIIEDYEICRYLDFVFAKARYAVSLNAVKPILSTDGKIKLKEARHPLINKNKVVPVTFTLGDTYNALIITGPNTGGKTVTLKTTGLLSLMAKSGFFIPAKEGATVAFYDNIFADIGDEQSIEQSLSTFSSHMKNIVGILDSVTENSLVLLDELGSGTDPAEGAALAIAIIENILSKGAKLMCTTHYAELKIFALQTPNVENASCEFDITTLMPTYRINIGIPGKSNAFAIASRLGISEEIISSAGDKLNNETVKVENVLADLEIKRKSIELDSERAAELRAAAEKKIRQIESELAEKQANAEKEIAKQKAKAAELLDRTKRDTDYMLHQIDELRKAKEKEDFKQRISQTRKEIDEKNEELEKETKTESKRVKKPLPRPLKVGDNVVVFSINKPGVVIEEADRKGYVLVGIGSIKSKIKLDDLELNDKVKKQPEPATILNLERGSRDVQTELDIRGMTALEADGVIDQVLNNAAMSHLNTISIIHGKGTGALRAAVQAKLRHHPLVAEFRLGVFGEGETGVTIVTLKK